MSNSIQNTISGGEALYRVLQANGVSCVFGLLGGSMLELYDAMYQHGDIRYVGARDERAAGHMADAYARTSGGVGVVLGAQAGPGVVNLVTAVAEAQLAYSPLVVIAGAISRCDHGKDTFQEMDQVALFAPICKRSIMVTDANRLVPMLEDAIRLAMSGRRGPVVLHVPRDLFAAEVPEVNPRAIHLAKAGAAREEDITRAMEILNEAKQPVIVAGGGLKWSQGSQALQQLAERWQIPVVASTGHADVMCHGHPWYAGQAGPRGNWVASSMTKEADAILVLGARLGFNSTFHSADYVNPKADIIHVDIEASAIGRYFPVALGMQADAQETTRAFAEHDLDADANTWRTTYQQRMQQLTQERQAEAQIDTLPLHPRRALAEIRAVLPSDAIVTIDTGNTCLQAADRLAHYQAPGLITPLDFGLVGFAMAAAIGAKASMPDRPVVSLMGDGAFGYTMIEVQTAVSHQLPVVFIVLDNGAWGAEKAYQEEFFGGRLLGAEIDNPRYDQFAELCGAKGYWIEKPGELGPVLQEALASGETCVIQGPIDPKALMTLRKDLFTKQ